MPLIIALIISNLSHLGITAAWQMLLGKNMHFETLSRFLSYGNVFWLTFTAPLGRGEGLSQCDKAPASLTASPCIYREREMCCSGGSGARGFLCTWQLLSGMFPSERLAIGQHCTLCLSLPLGTRSGRKYLQPNKAGLCPSPQTDLCQGCVIVGKG